jgi:hypothetical protein
MQFKAMRVEKMDEAGKGLARIAQLSAVDSDGDTYAKGAFNWKSGGGQWVSMIPAHDRRAMPFGKAWIYEDGDYAMADLNLNLDTQAGKDWHSTLKFDLQTGSPVQQWSYGFMVLDKAMERRDGGNVRLLKQLDVDEISPVLRGAGVGTTTLSMKSAELKGMAFAGLIANLGEMADALGADASKLSATGLKQLGEIHVALGKALAAPAEAKAAADSLVQQHLGEFLTSLARAHIRP